MSEHPILLGKRNGRGGHTVQQTGSVAAGFEPASLIYLLHQAPTPLVVLGGPEHRVDLINAQYVQLLRRCSEESLLGKPIREALPELEGQGFFELLDGVYETGVPYLGTEIRASLRREDNGVVEDAYFDFTYQPVRGPGGDMEGIMVQATDVTKHVRAREDFAHREQAIQAQWAELQAVYRSAGEKGTGWCEGQAGTPSGRETQASVPSDQPAKPSFRILNAERVLGSIAVTFDDGRCALYSAALLRETFPRAQELF